MTLHFIATLRFDMLPGPKTSCANRKCEAQTLSLNTSKRMRKRGTLGTMLLQKTMEECCPKTIDHRTTAFFLPKLQSNAKMPILAEMNLHRLFTTLVINFALTINSRKYFSYSASHILRTTLPKTLGSFGQRDPKRRTP